MEVVEQEIELKTLQITQEENSADSDTQSIVSEVIRLEEILNDSKLEATQDDVSFAEFCDLAHLRDTKPSTSSCGNAISGTVPFSVVANAVSARKNDDLKNLVETKKKHSDIPSPVSKPKPSSPKLGTVLRKNGKTASTGHASTLSVSPTASRKTSSSPKTATTVSQKEEKESLAIKVKQPALPKTSQNEEKPPSPTLQKSPKIPLAFAIMAGEVSVELPEPIEIEHKTIDQDEDEEDTDSEDSDSPSS